MVGLISDTHGLLRPEALEALAGSAHIIHAGDIGDPAILQALSAIAPLTVVRGNIDTEPWAAVLPVAATLRVQDAKIHVLHDLTALDQAAASGCAVVVSGHSHRPSVRREGAVLFINPGSAGRRRFRLPVSLGRLVLGGGRTAAELITLLPGG